MTTPHPPLNPNWQRLDPSYLQNRLTGQLLQQHSLIFTSPQHFAHHQQLIRKRLALQHPQIAKAIYCNSIQTINNNVVSYINTVYCEHPGVSLAQVVVNNGSFGQFFIQQSQAPLQGICCKILSAIDYLANAYGPFRLHPALIFIRTRRQDQRSYGTQGTTIRYKNRDITVKVWIHSRIQQCRKQQQCTQAEMVASTIDILRLIVQVQLSKVISVHQLNGLGGSFKELMKQVLWLHNGPKWTRLMPGNSREAQFYIPIGKWPAEGGDNVGARTDRVRPVSQKMTSGGQRRPQPFSNKKQQQTLNNRNENQYRLTFAYQPTDPYQNKQVSETDRIQNKSPIRSNNQTPKVRPPSHKMPLRQGSNHNNATSALVYPKNMPHTPPKYQNKANTRPATINYKAETGTQTQKGIQMQVQASQPTPKFPNRPDIKSFALQIQKKLKEKGVKIERSSQQNVIMTQRNTIQQNQQEYIGPQSYLQEINLSNKNIKKNQKGYEFKAPPTSSRGARTHRQSPSRFKKTDFVVESKEMTGFQRENQGDNRYKSVYNRQSNSVKFQKYKKAIQDYEQKLKVISKEKVRKQQPNIPFFVKKKPSLHQNQQKNTKKQARNVQKFPKNSQKQKQTRHEYKQTQSLYHDSDSASDMLSSQNQPGICIIPPPQKYYQPTADNTGMNTVSKFATPHEPKVQDTCNMQQQLRKMRELQHKLQVQRNFQQKMQAQRQIDERLQIQKQFEKEEQEDEQQSISKKNNREDYKHIRDKVKQKKQTFADLKREAAKILEDMQW